jgi:hypothetical protein
MFGSSAVATGQPDVENRSFRAVSAITFSLDRDSFGDLSRPLRKGRLPELRSSSEIDMKTAGGTRLAPRFSR